MANNVFCTASPARSWAGSIPGAITRSRKADYDLASPVGICDLPQNLLEPILLEAARPARNVDPLRHRVSSI